MHIFKVNAAKNFVDFPEFDLY